MLAEFIDKILGLSVPNKIEDGLVKWTDKEMHLLRPPMVAAIQLNTLVGFVDMFNARINGLDVGKVYVHIMSETELLLAELMTDPTARRLVHMNSKYSTKIFQFNCFLNHEAFIIGLLSKFVQTDSLKKLLEIASSLTTEAVSTSEDDGISQRATLKRGTQSLKKESTIVQRIKLAPFRTFTEVDQPESDFVFRLRSPDEEGGYPTCALFEADADAWTIEAKKNIAKYLKASGTIECPIVS